MNRDYVVSSNIASVGYDEATETLEVEFINSAIYQYYNVPINIYESLMRESSKGQFLHAYIKNIYPYSRV
ncbi:KTSC domain-containing protein [Amphritea sp.]|uniref:KTSC domain-containing protein n=1 Tax=Amphritea sp. TaxID=1872502 RepID=UPI003D09F8AD